MSYTSYAASPRLMRDAGFEPLFSEGDVAGGFFSLSTLRDGFEGFLPDLARKVVHSVDGYAEQIRAQIYEDLKARLGRNPTDDERKSLFHPALDQAYANRQEQMRRTLRVLNLVRWVAFGARADSAGVTIRLMVQLK